MMIGYVALGTHDVPRAVVSYDAPVAELAARAAPGRVAEAGARDREAHDRDDIGLELLA